MGDTNQQRNNEERDKKVNHRQRVINNLDHIKYTFMKDESALKQYTKETNAIIDTVDSPKNPEMIPIVDQAPSVTHGRYITALVSELLDEIKKVNAISRDDMRKIGAEAATIYELFIDQVRVEMKNPYLPSSNFEPNSKNNLDPIFPSGLNKNLYTDEKDKIDKTLIAMPDIFIVSSKESSLEDITKNDREITAKLVLAIEIVSPSNREADYYRKFDIYEYNQVNEYWLIDSKNDSFIQFKLESVNGEFRYKKEKSFKLSEHTQSFKSSALGNFTMNVAKLQDIYKKYKNLQHVDGK